MLIKITLVAIVICIALLIISRMYFRTPSTQTTIENTTACQ